MSLISVDNFIAPFTRMTHLIAIVLVALLFGAYRMAGGGISMVDSNSPRVIRQNPTTFTSPPLPRREADRSPTERSLPTTDDPFGDIERQLQRKR